MVVHTSMSFSWYGCMVWEVLAKKQKHTHNHMRMQTNNSTVCRIPLGKCHQSAERAIDSLSASWLGRLGCRFKCKNALWEEDKYTHTAPSHPRRLEPTPGRLVRRNAAASGGVGEPGGGVGGVVSECATVLGKIGDGSVCAGPPMVRRVG